MPLLLEAAAAQRERRAVPARPSFPLPLLPPPAPHPHGPPPGAAEAGVGVSATTDDAHRVQQGAQPPVVSSGTSGSAPDGFKLPVQRSHKRAASVEEVSPRQRALAQLHSGDIVQALDPVTEHMSPATIHSIGKNGLVKVRWHDPGHDEQGNPWDPIGEVWAEQIGDPPINRQNRAP